MKGATHNLVVRTRTEVARYVLNHKRGHLRDLENGFKVALAVIADPTVSAQQSFVIDRGEQVHTLEAAKALLAAQVSAPPLAAEQIEDEDELFDVDVETAAEVETEESEGLSEEAAGDADRDGPRRKRRRRRRGRAGGEARDEAAREAPAEDAQPFETGQAADLVPEEGESDDEESEDRAESDQPGEHQGDQANGERRPRRRGRRGGRRRRGGAEDGLAASISDELTPPSPYEAEGAVADFEGSAPAGAPSDVHAGSIAPAAEPQAAREAEPEEPAVSVPQVAPEPAEVQKAESDKTPRRSTVREKVTFMTEPRPPVAATSADSGESISQAESAPAPAAVAPAPSAAEPAAAEAPAPRRAGRWSRRGGGGEGPCRVAS